MPTLLRFLCTGLATGQTAQRAGQPAWLLVAPALAPHGGSRRRWHVIARELLTVDPLRGSVICWLFAASLAALCALGLAGCGGPDTGGGSAPRAGSEASRGFGTLTVKLVDVLYQPVEGATVTLMVGGSQRSKASTADGVATFDEVPIGAVTLAVGADGFEPLSVDGTLLSGRNVWDLSLIRSDAWAIGPAVILGTRMVGRSANGDSLVFSVDVAVIAGQNPEPLETLTAADFALMLIDCGWGGPRDCASDADGNPALGYGSYSLDGPPRAFALHPGSNRHPYLAGVVAERGGAGSDWDVKAPALKSFFAGLNPADAVGLASVQVEQDATTFTALGPFTGDGGLYLEAIDQLASPAGAQPSIAQAMPDAIRWTAATSDFPGSEVTLLWLTRGAYMSLEERDEAAALARLSGVHVSAIADIWADSDLGELAMLTGGFVSRVNDRRQYGSVFGVIDHVLAGTLPYYRIEYRLIGEPGLFSPGGNVRVYMRIDVPASFGTQPVYTWFDVAIPL